MIVLTGRSCSGKDSISKELINMGLKRIITYPSRPMRNNEIDGVTYHYISISDFLKKYIDGFFLEANYYTTEDGIWFYGSPIEEIRNADKNTFCILTPSGIQMLKENKIKNTSFLIHVSDEEIMKRQIGRGDDKREAERRFNEDKRDFYNVENLVHYIVNNENKDPIDAAVEINNIYKKEAMLYEV